MSATAATVRTLTSTGPRWPHSSSGCGATLWATNAPPESPHHSPTSQPDPPTPPTSTALRARYHHRHHRHHLRPQDPLKGSQITRFLYRTLNKTGNTTCGTGTGSELDDATACLLQLHVIPTQAEATAAAAVTRAQMAVYVIGLWHNLTGRGLPPTPPPVAQETIPEVGGLQIAVTVTVGASAKDQPGCTSDDCRYLQVALEHAPEGNYNVACWSSLDTEQPWYTDTWHWPTSDNWHKPWWWTLTPGGCWYEYPGEQVWVVVSNAHGSVTSEPLTWPMIVEAPIQLIGLDAYGLMEWSPDSTRISYTRTLGIGMGFGL